MDPASLFVAYLLFELVFAGLAAQTLFGVISDGFRGWSRGAEKRRGARDKARRKTLRGRAWIAVRDPLLDFGQGVRDGGKRDHTIDPRKRWRTLGQKVRDWWEPIQEQAGGEGGTSTEGPSSPSGTDTPSPAGGGQTEEECEHKVKQQECPICKGKAAAGEGPSKPAPGDKPPATTPAPSPAGPTSAVPTKGAAPVSDSTELTAPKVVDFWDHLADQAAAQVEAEQAAGLDVPGGADVVDRLRSHAGAAHGEFDQMIEAASGTGHQTGERYRAA